MSTGGHKKASTRVRKAPKAYAFIQQGGASNEYYLFVHDTQKQAEKHQKSCHKAAYQTSDLYRVRGDADFEALAHSVENTLGRDDWKGADYLLCEIAA